MKSKGNPWQGKGFTPYSGNKKSEGPMPKKSGGCCKGCSKKK